MRERTTDAVLNADSELPPEPRPRDFWIFDQVCRRGRTQRDVAEDVRLTQARICQICADVQMWMDHLWDECVPQGTADVLKVRATLLRWRRAAEKMGHVPPSPEPAVEVDRALGKLLGFANGLAGATY